MSSMNLVTGALGSVIPKLALLLKEEYDLHKGVKKKITRLTRDLESMHAALRKVAEVPPDQLDDEVKLWARDVREMSYDAEDVVDRFLVRVEGREARDPSRFKRAAKMIGTLFSKSKARHQIGGMIKIIDEKARVVAERHRRYRAGDIVAKPAAKSTVDPRLAAMYKEVKKLVGIKKSSDDLISMMSPHGDGRSKTKMKVVSVFGVGGLGKTTLARAVFQKLKVDFKCTAFVPVGQNPDLKKVLRDVLIEFDRERYIDTKWTTLDEKQLIDEIRGYLEKSGRYFIIIDDIWEKKSWETIQLALFQNNSGSRVIITTRNMEVAIKAGAVYKLQSLPCDVSKKLFYRRVFGAEGKCPDDHLDKVSDKILKKCAGVPLAIITMASLLLNKSREQWTEVCNSIAFHDKDNKQANETEWILSLSYYDLPPHLKTCLLYLSAFPEDYVIDKSCLIWKWIAEGFVHSKPGTRMFEVGEGYFNDLINRSMIMALQPNDDGIVKGCYVHDMVLDLLRVKSQEENFVTISGTNPEGTSSPSTLRRLAQQKRTVEQTHQDTEVDLQHIRTFVACGCIVYPELSFLSFGLLRVLALEDCYGRQQNNPIQLKDLESLLHLRYLGLRRTWIHALPDKIGSLKYLQTLNLWQTGIRQLPYNVGLLTQLIYLNARGMKVQDGVIDKLTSLEELHITVDDAVGQFVKDLGKLRELRVLEVEFVPGLDTIMQSDLVKSLGNLHKIRHVQLVVDRISWDQALWDTAVLPQRLKYLGLASIWFYTLPSCINPSVLTNLSHLGISVHALDEHGLKILSGLPDLRYLFLSTYSTVTLSFHAADDCFQQLTCLVVPLSMVQFALNEDSSVSFTIWNGEDDMDFGSKTRDKCIVAPAIMRNLKVVEFQVEVEALVRNTGSCENLGLEYLPSLQNVEVTFLCDGAFLRNKRKEKDALVHAIKAHPNRPTLQMDIYGKDGWKSDTETEEEEDSDTETEEEDTDTKTEEEEDSDNETEEDEDVTRSPGMSAHPRRLRMRDRPTLKFSVQPQSEPDERADDDDQLASHFAAGIPTFSLGAQGSTTARLRKSRIHRRPGASSSLVSGVSRDSTAASPLEERFKLACSLTGDSDAS